MVKFTDLSLRSDLFFIVYFYNFADKTYIDG